MALRGRAALVLVLALCAMAGRAQATAPTTPPKPKPAGSPAAAPFKPVDESQPDVWIFSGVLADNNETYSGTLVSGRNEAEFEMKLADGATCDGSQLKGEVGLVRLSEIACSDGRSMRALFVPQGGKLLKVFGHVGDARFIAAAHLLGTDAEPERPQTAQPTVPQVQPPMEPEPAPQP